MRLPGRIRRRLQPLRWFRIGAAPPTRFCSDYRHRPLWPGGREPEADPTRHLAAHPGPRARARGPALQSQRARSQFDSVRRGPHRARKVPRADRGSCARGVARPPGGHRGPFTHFLPDPVGHGSAGRPHCRVSPALPDHQARDDHRILAVEHGPPVSGEIDFAFIGAAVAPRSGLVLRPVDRQEVVVVIPLTHRFAQLERVPIESLRGEPIVAVIAGINPKLNAAGVDWLTKYTGEPLNIIREEPPDQIAGALGQSGNAVAFMSLHRAVIARAEGLDYRPLIPSLFVEYGVAYARDNPSPPLANLLAIIEEIAPPTSADLPNDSELLWGKSVGSPA